LAAIDMIGSLFIGYTFCDESMQTADPDELLFLKLDPTASTSNITHISDFIFGSLELNSQTILLKGFVLANSISYLIQCSVSVNDGVDTNPILINTASKIVQDCVLIPFPNENSMDVHLWKLQIPVRHTPLQLPKEQISTPELSATMFAIDHSHRLLISFTNNMQPSSTNTDWMVLRNDIIDMVTYEISSTANDAISGIVYLTNDNHLYCIENSLGAKSWNESTNKFLVWSDVTKLYMVDSYVLSVAVWLLTKDNAFLIQRNNNNMCEWTQILKLKLEDVSRVSPASFGSTKFTSASNNYEDPPKVSFFRASSTFTLYIFSHSYI
jgi:hypothetical protein